MTQICWKSRPFFTFVLLTVYSLLLWSGPVAEAQIPPVDIPDDNLRAALEEKLGKKPGEPIFDVDMATLTDFAVPNLSISDLTGLEHATNLMSLKLGPENVEDVSDCPSDAESNKISDLSPLADLTNLEVLNLSCNQVSAVNPLAKLTNLRTLDLRYNQVNDVSPLAELTNLTLLNLRYNQVNNVSPLAELTNLTILDLENTQISDLSVLAGLTELTEVNLKTNQISDISPLEKLTNLTILDLGANQISDISPVSGLINLKELYLWTNQISDINPISDLTNLIWLFLYSNQISDINSLANLINLDAVRLDSNQITNIGPLANLTNLGTQPFRKNFIEQSLKEDDVDVRVNPLSYKAINTDIPTLQGRGVGVIFDDRTPTTLSKISGDNQSDDVGTALPNPFVVEVRDQNNKLFEGVPVAFAVTAGGGSLNVENTVIDASGLAFSTLTLGPIAGINTVKITAAEIAAPVTCNAPGIQVNNAPSFDAIANQVVLEDAGTTDVPITGISPGPANEANQTVSLTAVSSDASIVPNPTITGVGATRTLSFSPVADANGTVTITVTAEDDGGTENSGVDAFQQPFTITVTPKNNAPSFNTIPDQSVLEDSGTADVPITGVSPGPANEANQTVSLMAVSSDASIVPNPTVAGVGGMART